MARTRDFGRIWFPGNPWPKGHAITAFRWSARVERSSGIWFDLHLETAAYKADDPPDYAEEDDDLGAWESRVLWYNHYACTLSSVEWVGSHYGFQAGSATEPLDFARIAKRPFAFDGQPRLDYPRPFGIYLTGHDAVAGHRIRFKREPGKRTYAVEWSGKIAMEYSGDEKFRYAFNAKIRGANFEGIQFPVGTSAQDALDLIQPFVSDFLAYKAKKTESGLRLLPR